VPTSATHLPTKSMPETNFAKNSLVNRGAYLVEGLGHCGTCDTPKNITGGDRDREALQGALLQDWYAPDANA
jgi:hypothetical protein